MSDDPLTQERKQILAARQGNEEALAALVDAHWEDLHYLVASVARKPSIQDELLEPALTRFLDLILHHFDPDHGVLLWTYTKKVLRRHLIRYVTTKQTNRRLIDLSDVPESVVAASSPYLVVELRNDFSRVQRYTHLCLKDPVLANKWIILTVLHRGLGLSWEVIVTNLQDGVSFLKKNEEAGTYDWAYIRQACGLAFDIPATWQDGCALFNNGRDRAGRLVPKVTRYNLTKWHGRITKRCLACYPEVFQPIAAPAHR